MVGFYGRSVTFINSIRAVQIHFSCFTYRYCFCEGCSNPFILFYL